MTTTYASSTTSHHQLASSTPTDQELNTACTDSQHQQVDRIARKSFIIHEPVENKSVDLSKVALMPTTTADRLTAPVPTTIIKPEDHIGDIRKAPMPTANHTSRSSARSQRQRRQLRKNIILCMCQSGS